MTSARLKIAVIGAGIGGLTAALSLRRASFDVDVYEQAPVLTEVGGGINMGPNAVRILYRLGLAERSTARRSALSARINGAGRMAARCSGHVSTRCANSCTAHRI